MRTDLSTRAHLRPMESALARMCRDVQRNSWKRILLSILMLSGAFSIVTPAAAEKATPAVRATINGLLTSYVPNVTQSQTTSGGITFTHPGVILNKAALDTIQNHVRAGDEPWASAFVQFAGYAKNSKTPFMNVNINDTRPSRSPGVISTTRVTTPSDTWPRMRTQPTSRP